MKTAIWTEGIADQKFLADLIEEWHGFHFEKSGAPSIKDPEREKLKFSYKTASGSISIFDLEGKDGFLKVENAEEYKELFNIFDSNLVILDADKDFGARILELEKVHLLFDDKFSFYLFPNNSDSGDLETLLTKITNPENTAIFECWSAYEDCLRSKENLKRADRKFTTPASKTKIYAYLEALLGESKKQKKLIKEAEREYWNEKHWNLKSGELKPLKEFLQKNLSLT